MSKTLTQDRCRNLVIVLGDQLNIESSAFDGFDKQQDAVWMAEASDESTHVWSHKARIALFLAAMRHFRNEIRKRGFNICYRQLDDSKDGRRLAAVLETSVRALKPEKLIVVEPGEWRVRASLLNTAHALGLELEIRPDRHFLCSRDEFAEHAAGRRQLRLEYFYREMRRRHSVLMDGDVPEGGKWNFDRDNRGSFGKAGPPMLPPTRRFRPDAVTREVIGAVNQRFADHPGCLDDFDWPVTRRHALQALEDFIHLRLPFFGQYQDAMWSDEPHLFHSRLSAALNLKLLSPLEVIAAAVDAFNAGEAPLNSVEGFVRQILGWREFVRGVYWRYMPEYLERNSLQDSQPLPGFFWTGETEMNCLSQVIGQTLKYGYAHHIQRLMVTGLFVLLLGVDPKAVHEWYLAVYVDAVEWVELPNTLGMSQFADGGVMASKPYAASGKYIQRMSNYCENCRFNPSRSCGEDACPFTTLYWDFLDRHQELLQKNTRISLQLKNLARKDTAEISAIRAHAHELRSALMGEDG